MVPIALAIYFQSPFCSAYRPDVCLVFIEVGNKRLYVKRATFLMYKAFSFSSNTQISKKFVKSGF
jgi:hypothetical protein